VAFDNRGTGQSGLIDCPPLQKTITGDVDVEARLAAECANTIGPQRIFYSTRDHADDTDAVRAALGVDKIGLYGVSYGTKLSLAYALGYPTHVERLVLDSVVPAQLPDPFDRNVLQEMPNTLSNFCAGGICRAATKDYGGDVVKLANRIESKPLKGTVIAPDGKVTRLTMNGEDFLSMLIDADLTPGLPAGSLGPFGSWAARTGTAFFCEQWPSPAGNAPLGSGPLPDVPMIALDGGFDLRTPVVNAIAVERQFPQGKLLVVPGVGHSVT